jgi:hypothetical protein
MLLLLLRPPNFGESEGFAFRGEAAENSLITIGVELLRWRFTALNASEVVVRYNFCVLNVA